ncbi:alpha/beta fold hydrolase [Aquabacter spiritensis]|uniref:Pimeloyl-ACP methyl ester carboxylesterase n=1 Tax=Aquabacter spiritensis TaxID=933073 RepID=A0A4R3LQU6_9HYPH|nr:alpha/beta hydrolase [Aquabacter spiritensis]TCT02076.1 pimeloyl-ACP methyl ester carboxylesterase [Aquabacter spiritensis]
MDRFASNDGIDLAYDLEGRGPPLLIIGGLAADRIFWALARPLLSDFTTLCFDNRDAGASGRAESAYNVADMARDALAVMDAAGWEKAHVLGHSLGGAIAQELALLAPERVDSLILANTLAHQDGYTRGLLALLTRLRRELADEVTFVSTLATFTLGRATLATASLDAIARQALATSPLQEIAAFERQAAACRGVDTLARIGAIQARTLVLATPDDRFFAPVFARRIADAIPGARLQDIPLSGHCPMIEVPDAFAKAVRDFLVVA